MRGFHRIKGLGPALLTLAVALAVVPASAGAELQLRTTAYLGDHADLTGIVEDPTEQKSFFVLQRSGVIKRTSGKRVSNFLDLRSIVDDDGYEQGLFSMALSPDFRRTHRFYVAYSAGTNGDALLLDEFEATPEGKAIPSSRRNVLEIPHPDEQHYGGHAEFGPDGQLYVSVGDSYRLRAAQTLGSLLGKVLRINPRQFGSAAYRVPAGNPFVGKPGRDEIWSYGMRNPFRFTFDRKTDAMLLADVGEVTSEEVNLFSRDTRFGRGQNLGWPCFEGSFPYLECPDGDFTPPIFEYPHTSIDDSPDRCAIIGGHVMRDPTLPEMHGRYVYGDICGGQIRSVMLGQPESDRLEIRLEYPQAFGEDARGHLYVVNVHGYVYRLA